MTEKSFFAGFGGQGIISMGQLWVYFGMKTGLEVTFFPYYGAEKRGGVARASVIVSSEEIASPLVTRPDSAVVMHQDSLDEVEAMLKGGGLLLLNDSLVKREPARKDIRVKRVKANEIAESLGDLRIANMVMLGALAKATGAIEIEAHAEAILKDFFPGAKSKLVPINLEALKKGHGAV